MAAAARRRGGRPRNAKAQDATAIAAAIVRNLRRGLSRNDVAALVGVGRGYIRDRCRDDPVFSAQVAAAEIETKARIVELIHRASVDEWRAAAWILERRYPTEYGRRDPDAITPDQLSAIVGRIVTDLLTSVPSEYHATIREKIERLFGALSERQRKISGASDASL